MAASPPRRRANPDGSERSVNQPLFETRAGRGGKGYVPKSKKVREMVAAAQASQAPPTVEPSTAAAMLATPATQAPLTVELSTAAAMLTTPATQASPMAEPSTAAAMLAKPAATAFGSAAFSPFLPFQEPPLYGPSTEKPYGYLSVFRLQSHALGETGASIKPPMSVFGGSAISLASRFQEPAPIKDITVSLPGSASIGSSASSSPVADAPSRTPMSSSTSAASSSSPPIKDITVSLPGSTSIGPSASSLVADAHPSPPRPKDSAAVRLPVLKDGTDSDMSMIPRSAESLIDRLSSLVIDDGFTPNSKDDDACKAPAPTASTANASTHVLPEASISTQLRSRTKAVNYDLEYHPSDNVLRPKFAARRLAQGTHRLAA